MIGNNEELGKVEVAYTTLTKAPDSDPMEFMIMPPKGKTQDAGYLLIRCRKATREDEKSMSDKKNKKNYFATTTTEAVEAVRLLNESKDVAGQAETKTTKEESVATRDVPVQEAGRVVKPKPGEELHLKVEIVSARGLLAADKNGRSDPYVKMLMNGKDLHKTKHLNKTYATLC